MADLRALRARVEAAQALAAKAPAGPYEWSVYASKHNARLCTEAQFRADDGYLLELSVDRVPSALADLLAAAPDLVTLAADLLAALEAAQAERDEACAALGNGADEAARRPGETLAEAVGRLRGEHRSLRDVLQWVNDQCPGKCSAVCDSVLRAGHEGPHAEALGDNGGTR